MKSGPDKEPEVRTTDSNGSNKSERGLSMIQPRMVINGMTKRAIWILEPTATPIFGSRLTVSHADPSQSSSPQTTYREINLVVYRDRDFKVARVPELATERPNFSIRKRVYAPAVTCSAALPTMGSKIKPTHSVEISGCCSVRPLIESTRNSAVTARTEM